MAKLILSMDGLVLKEIALGKPRITIGRKPHNDIQIDNLAISGEHAAISTIVSDSFLEDLNSTNGTYVNGKMVRKHFLQNNDVVELGKYRLKYINEAPAWNNATEYSGTGFSGNETIIEPDFGMEQAGAAAAVMERPVVQAPPKPLPAGLIRILTGTNSGKSLALTKELTTLGKQGTQVMGISRGKDGYALIAMEGPPPLVNGAPVSAGPRLLRDRDQIEFSGVRMEFALAG